MGGKGGGRIGACELHLQAHEEGGEADKGGCRGAGIGAPGACYVGEHVVVRTLEGDAPLFVAAEFFNVRTGNVHGHTCRVDGGRTGRSPIPAELKKFTMHVVLALHVSVLILWGRQRQRA